MSSARIVLRKAWQRFLPGARIRLRIVIAVVLAMSVVLLATGAFVYWRVSFALDRQLNQDLDAYTKVVRSSLAAGEPLPTNDLGLVVQTFSRDGRVLAKSDPGVRTLLTTEQVRGATTSAHTRDIGRFIPPPSEDPYRVSYQLSRTPGERVVIATGIDRRKHDEALRELLLQLTAADFATVLAAGLVGWGVTRAALGPVERYRRAAAGNDLSVRLPVEPGREDELSRLGNTFNGLLDQIELGRQRERQFLADASHELRSPLALLAAEVEWARHRPRSPAEIDQVLTSVADQTQRLAALADALLNLEEATEAGPGATSTVTISELVDRAAQPFQAQARTLGRTIEIIDSDQDVRVEVSWIELALSNLVANALRHGHGAVRVEARREADRLLVEVTDDGAGIPAALGTAAFERFARADDSRTTPGHGLGLAIVVAVAERHHGTVELVPGGVRLSIEAER